MIMCVLDNLCFSIIMPTYNRAAFLPKAIESVLAQKYTDWELIIVDDGSTDNTKEVVSQYGDSRITYIYQENAERSAARNNGINHAKGDYICFMDSDEYLYSERLEELSKAIKNNSNRIACYYTDIRFEGCKNYIRTGIPFSFHVDNDELISRIIGAPQLCCASEILRKHQFNQALSIGEDTELLFRIAADYPLIYIPNQATVVEVEHEERSVAFANKSKASEKELKALELMFAQPHPASKVSARFKRARLATAYFNASKNYLLDGKWMGLRYLCKSIIINPRSKQLKYKINIALSFLMCKKEKLKRLLEE